MDPVVASPAARPARRVPPLLMIGILIIFLGLMGGSAWAFSTFLPRQPDGTPTVGSVAPPISLRNLDGKTVSLADYRGHPVLVNFWAQWCVPCRSEMPAIDAVARANPNVVVLAVDVLDGPALVRQYLQQVPLGFTPVLDLDGQVAGVYKVSSLPSSFFVGSDGVIRAVNVGPMDQSTIEAKLKVTTR
jgi:thiol-disulfide isomerase/thioredoxin